MKKNFRYKLQKHVKQYTLEFKEPYKFSTSGFKYISLEEIDKLFFCSLSLVLDLEGYKDSFTQKEINSMILRNKKGYEYTFDTPTLDDLIIKEVK